MFFFRTFHLYCLVEHRTGLQSKQKEVNCVKKSKLIKALHVSKGVKKNRRAKFFKKLTRHYKIHAGNCMDIQSYCCRFVLFQVLTFEN